MITNTYPEKYLLHNTSQTKQLNVVVQIQGVADLFSMVPTYTRLRYGDPGLHYGDPGLIYGGLRKLAGVHDLIAQDSSLAISQRLEPESAKASISTLSIAFVDLDGLMSRLVSPGGGVLDELMGNRDVKVWYGYADTSYPEDYFVVFRGQVSQVVCTPTKIVMTFSDPNLRRRSAVFLPEKSKLTLALTNVATSVQVVASTGFYHQIQDGAGVVDPGVQTYLKIEDEFLEYDYGDVVSPTQVNVSRGDRGTTAAAHNIDTEVVHAIQIQDNAITLSLKIMLSGWNGPYISGIAAAALGSSLDPGILDTNVLVLLEDSDVEYGLTIGDFVIVTNSSFGNNGTYQITDIQDSLSRPNRLLYLDQNLTLENPATGVTLAFRSKYDTLPVGAGLMLKPSDVDVAGHEKMRSRFFSGSENVMRLLILDQQTGKDYIEQEIYRPIRAYSLTRYGRLSMGYTRPPIPDDKIIFIDQSNIIDPEQISHTRSLTTRRFYNQIKYEFDQVDDGHFESVDYEIDNVSEARIQITSTLSISSAGVKSSLGGAILVSRVARALLARFKNVASEITLKVNWRAGSLIEAGDVVVLTDNGTLKITNFNTGARDMGQVLLEVINRTLDPKQGYASLTLLGGLTNTLTDRYGTISPSSQIVASGSSTTQLKIRPSFGDLFRGKEYLKWKDYLGLNVRIHNRTWTRSATVVLQGINLGDPFTLELASALPFTPQDDDVIDLAQYPDNTNKKDQQLAKLLHGFLSPTLTVTGGISSSSFTVSAPDAAKIQIGLPVMIHNADYSIASPESNVLSVVGTTVTVATPLGFTPAAGQKVDFVGFKDGSGAYRWL